jgi:hypothetical protein
LTIFRGPGGGGNATSDSALNALTALTNEASNSATVAGASATAASVSEGNAASSAAAAASSASGASTSATTATTQASAASTSASGASTSASNGAASAAAALASQNAAAVSQSTASTAATTATTQAGLATTNGAAQVALATTQAGSAATSAAASSTSATGAASSASAAFNSAATATTQAGIATTQAGLATTNGAAQVALATTQAGNAASSATGASSSASAASTSASNASTSATNASNSATAAANSAASINDANLVHKTGNETIAGTKTFTSSVVVPSITFPDLSTLQTAPSGFGFKNRIINGDMRISQRNAGAGVTPTDGQYLVDRWVSTLSAASKYTAQQSSTAPTGFNTSQLVTSSSAYSVTSGDIFAVSQKVEGYNFADMGWGTSSAQAVTLSFWVRSSLTGTFGGSFTNNANNRSYPFTYTITSANTFEYKTVTVAGDTTGTWIGGTNGIAVRVWFGLGVGTTYSGAAGSWASSAYFSATGATSVVGTSGATFYITGVQLEKGSTATAFDYRDYGRELSMCQRYFWKTLIATGFEGVAIPGVSIAYGNVLKLPVTMRVTPTVTSAGFVDSGNMNGNTFADINPDYFMARGSTFSGVGGVSKAAGYYQAGITVSAEL